LKDHKVPLDYINYLEEETLRINQLINSAQNQTYLNYLVKINEQVAIIN